MKIDIKNLQKYNCKINTDSGFEDVTEVFQKEEECIEIHFSNWEILKVARNHLFETNNNIWTYASSLEINSLVISDNNYIKVVNIIDIGKNTVYDLTVNTYKHQYYANGISSHNSGKTLLAVSAGMKMIKQGKYDKIIYIRNSVESIDKAEAVGFLSGNEEKFKIYNHPLYDTLDFISQVDLNKKNAGQTQSDIDARVNELCNKYNISTMWNGEIRGRTVRNAFIIVDEVQNFAKSSLQTVLSRTDEDSKVVCIGSNRQIDHPYINKYTNGLSTLIEVSKEESNEVTVFGTELDKVVRGRITEWAERIFEKK